MGMDEPLTNIFALVYISPEEIALDELAKKTNYSLASISNKIKMLELMSVVKKIRKPKSKKLYVYMEKDFLKILKDHMFKKQKHIINFAKDHLPEMIKENKARKLDKKEKQELKMIENYYESMLKFDIIVKDLIKNIERMDK